MKTSPAIYFDEELGSIIRASNSWIRHKADLSATGTSSETAELRSCDGYMLVPTNSAKQTVDLRSVRQRFPSVAMLRVLETQSHLDELPIFERLQSVWIVGIDKREKADISSLKHLSSLYIESSARLSGYENPSLESLIVFRTNIGFDNLDFLDNFPNLKELWLIGGRYGDLEGLKYVPNLLKLRLVDLRRITSFNGIQHLADSLLVLGIDGCSGAQDLNHLAGLHRLRDFFLFNRKQIPSLSFCKGMHNLRFFSFPQTDVADGKISELRSLEFLNNTYFTNKRHFDLKRKDFNHGDQ